MGKFEIFDLLLYFIVGVLIFYAANLYEVYTYNEYDECENEVSYLAHNVLIFIPV